MKKILIALSFLGLSQLVSAQCCDVVSSNGVSAVSSNGICAITSNGVAGDCNKQPAVKDTDSDGVTDDIDVCPDVAGIAANKGCPAVSVEEVAILKSAIKGVKFETEKDIITPESFPILDNVVKVLNAKPQYKLSIEGHTDSQGDDAFNLDLSKKRAAAVKHYLESKGIPSYKLFSEGFGETKPVGDNTTAEGRAENRRVELIVKF